MVRRDSSGHTRFTPEGKSIKFHRISTELILEGVGEHISKAYNKIVRSFEDVTQLGSGWKLEKIRKLELCTAKYEPL